MPVRYNPILQIRIWSPFSPLRCVFLSFCVFLHKDQAEKGCGQDGVGGRLILMPLFLNKNIGTEHPQWLKILLIKPWLSKKYFQYNLKLLHDQIVQYRNLLLSLNDFSKLSICLASMIFTKLNYYNLPISSAVRPVNRIIFSTGSPSDFIWRAISILRSSLPSALPSSNEVSTTFFKSR